MSARSREDACRVLVGSEWVVCGISFEEASHYIEQAAARGADWASPFGLPGVGPVLTQGGERRAMVMLVTSQPFVVAGVDYADAARLKLGQAPAAQEGEGR